MTIKKLTYFNGRGRAELIRFVLHSQNEKFEDERLSHEQWPAIKPTTPCGQLPILTLENGTVMNESMAVAKYLARKAKLYGKNEMDAYYVDRALDTILEFYNKAVTAFFEKDENKKAELNKDLKEKIVPQYFGNLTKYVEEAKGEFLAGSEITVADFFLCIQLDNFCEAKSHYPKLGNIYNKVMVAFPGIKKHIETRPDTPF